MSANAKEEVLLSNQAAEPYSNGMAHLQDELKRIDLLIERRIGLFRKEISANQAVVAAVKHQYISDEEVDSLLSPGDQIPYEGGRIDASIWMLNQQIDQRILASLENGVFLPAVHLAQVFSLSDFEYLALMVCMAPELRRKYDRLYAYLQDDITRKRPSRDLILRLLFCDEEEGWHARTMLQRGSALLDAGLLREVDDLHSPSGSSDLAKFFALDPHVLEFLLGHFGIDSRLTGIASIVNETAAFDIEADSSKFREHLLSRLEASTTDTRRDAVPLVFLSGSEGAGKRTCLSGICAELGNALLELDLRHFNTDRQTSEWLLTLAVRDSSLLQAPLLLSHGELLNSEDHPVALHWDVLASILIKYGWFVCVTSDRPIRTRGMFRKFLLTEHVLPLPESKVIEGVWGRCLEKHGVSVKPADITTLSRQFVLSAGQINDAVRLAVTDFEIERGGCCKRLSAEQLASACRKLSNQKLATLASKIEPEYGWNDIVLPTSLKEQLLAICSQVEHRDRVLNEWGFAEKYRYGRGISAMFSGPPGTGKTMAAQVLAKTLGLDMYKIDLSSVVSKYIGETEKNLARIFQEAETSNAVLVFDECDALYGKRTEISDAHDRYANIEVSFLLQKMEEYNGIVILTTNLRNNIDEAFIRRIRFIADFPFPDGESRREIWETLLPNQLPHVSDSLNFKLLAEHFVIAGGSIKNIVLNAAFMAASENDSIGMRQILKSARYEFEKIGKLWDEQQFVRHLEIQGNVKTNATEACQNG